MKTITYVVQDEVGIHARPAGQLVQLAKGFTCSIKLQKNDKEADVKSIISVLGLGVNQGDHINFILNGADEDKAHQALSHFLINNL